MAHSRKARKRVRRLHQITTHLRAKSATTYDPRAHFMTVHRYNPVTGNMDRVPDARGEYYNTKTERWESWDAVKDNMERGDTDVYQFFDRYDKTKSIWVQDVYKDGHLSRTQERGWASKAMSPPSSHSPLCECVECLRNKRAKDGDSGDEDTVHTASCACTACVVKRAALRPEEHTYKGETNYHHAPYGQTRHYTSYAPTKLYEKLDRRRWPNTWGMLVVFTFHPDYYKDTRVQPEQQEYTLYGE